MTFTLHPNAALFDMTTPTTVLICVRKNFPS
jgi:hypothetical protein